MEHYNIQPVIQPEYTYLESGDVAEVVNRLGLLDSNMSRLLDGLENLNLNDVLGEVAASIGSSLLGSIESAQTNLQDILFSEINKPINDVKDYIEDRKAQLKDAGEEIADVLKTIAARELKDKILVDTGLDETFQQIKAGINTVVGNIENEIENTKTAIVDSINTKGPKDDPEVPSIARDAAIPDSTVREKQDALEAGKLNVIPVIINRKANQKDLDAGKLPTKPQKETEQDKLDIEALKIQEVHTDPVTGKEVPLGPNSGGGKGLNGELRYPITDEPTVLRQEIIAAMALPFYFVDLRTNNYAFFNATLDSLDETYSPSWNSENFFGRADGIHYYQSTSRQLNFSFTIMPEFYTDLKFIYKKMEGLAQAVYPKYKDNDSTLSYSKMPLLRMRIGDVIKNDNNQGLGGFLTTLNYNYDLNGGGDLSDGSKVPRVVKVTASFQVVHDFAPDFSYNSVYYDIKAARTPNDTEIYNIES